MHGFEVNRSTTALGMISLGVVMLSVGVPLGWAEQRATNHPVRVEAPQKSKQAAATAAPEKSSHPPAQREDNQKESEPSSSPGARRDPFKLPEIPTGKGGAVLDSAGGILPPGVRGLLISQIRLEGVVREQAGNKMIAVVTNDTRRAYFLTENESVYNGVVSKITPDAVYFAENVLDPHGRVTTHEVVKRLGSAPGEGR